MATLAAPEQRTAERLTRNQADSRQSSPRNAPAERQQPVAGNGHKKTSRVVTHGSLSVLKRSHRGLSNRGLSNRGLSGL